LIHAKKVAKYETCNKKSNVFFKFVSSALMSNSETTYQASILIRIGKSKILKPYLYQQKEQK